MSNFQALGVGEVLLTLETCEHLGGSKAIFTIFSQKKYDTDVNIIARSLSPANLQ